MGLPQYNANTELKVTRKYFSGTTTLRNGQLLAIDYSASKTDADPKKRMGVQVVALGSTGAGRVAGIVSESDAGKVGPCFVDLQIPGPGEIVVAEVDGTADVAAGDLLEPDDTLGALIKATAAAGDNLFRALEANTTNAVKTANIVQKI